MLDLAADGIEPTAAQAAVVAERVPAGVERAVLARLGRLDHAAQRLAQAVAVVGEDSGLRLAARMAELDIDTAAAAADALLTAELLAEARPLRFAHPLVRSAIYEQLALGARTRAHARAATLLRQEDADLEQVAAQLLLSEPAGDLDAVQALRGAAAAALARGAPQTAVGYLRRALAEPPPQRDRAAVLGELGAAERIGRDPAALIHLQQAWGATAEPVARARLADQLADVLFYAGDLERCSAVLGAALADIGDRDPDLAVRLHSAKAGIEAHSLHPPPLDRLWELAKSGVAASRSVQLTLANVLAARGRHCAAVSDLVRRGLDDGRFIAEETFEALPAILAVYALVFVDELARANDLTEAMVADARARGSVLGYLAASGLRGWVALRRGALAEAEADTAAALELAIEHHLAFSIPFIAAYLSLTLLERGEIEQAAAVVEAVAINPALAEVPAGPTLFEARGRVRLARGQRAQGITDLRRCGQGAERIDTRNPNTFGWRFALALALASEHPEQAHELAQTELALALRVGAPRAMG
ncbi:MAG TPA: hypothetical protein VK898_15965, partial [Chloroflexota bacterium]|nr:hypothetical protein [Chloroflexota bacterium]